MAGRGGTARSIVLFGLCVRAKVEGIASLNITLWMSDTCGDNAAPWGIAGLGELVPIWNMKDGALRQDGTAGEEQTAG